MNIQSSVSTPVFRTGRRFVAGRQVNTGPLTPPLQSLLSSPIPPGHDFTPAQIKELTRYIHRTLPILPGDELNLFLSTLMEDASVVAVLMRPREVQEEQERADSRVHLPFDLAWQAGVRAQGSALLLPHEKPIAWVGAFAYSCGLFMCADPIYREDAGTEPLDPKRVRNMRYLVLAQAFHELRNRNNAVGEALAAAMGLMNPDDGEPDQIARIGTAVRLANLRIESLWGFHHG
jgi:hypothetical protein